MYIDFTLQISDILLDISADHRQCIGDTVKEVLRREDIIYPDYYFSAMQCRMVSAFMTFEEEHIKNGDKLVGAKINYGK